MRELEIHLLGPWQVLRHREPLTGFRHDKVRALLAYLVVEADRPHRRESLAALLWPEQPESTALHNLRQSLSLLRQALGDETATSLLTVTTKTVELRLDDSVRVDVTDFTRLIRECGHHAHRRLEACPACQTRLRDAARLYRGEFLAGLSVADSVEFEEWRLFTQETLHREALDVLSHLVSYHTRRAEYRPAADYLRRQLALAPWREEAHRDLMRLLALSGERSAALVQYQTCRKVLAQELGVEPAPETQALWQAIRSGQPLDASASPVAPRSVRSPLQAPLTPLIGREVELGRLTELALDPATHLLTLVGPGGVGKSRLAQALAAEIQTSFSDGVYLVPLSGLEGTSTPREALVAAIANTLQLVSPGSGGLETRVLDYAREREILLVLDSFEHLLLPVAGPSVEFVLALLHTAPKTLVVVTCRQPLAVQAERVVPIKGLAYLSPGQPPTMSPSVRLFADRAQRASDDFRLDDTVLFDVSRICHLVDGLPLGIELAAALTLQHTPAAIAAALDRDLSALAVQRHDLPTRHHSLRAVFETSWRLLSGIEQRVLAQCSVFQGGFTPPAAEAVVGGGRREAGDGLPALGVVLAALVAKSLLRWDDQAQRYDMHDVVRHFAGERLAELAEEGSHDRHSDYYLAQVEQHEASLRGTAPLAALGELRREWANIHAAWQWVAHHERVTDLARSLEGLARLIDMASLFAEGEALFGGAAAHLASGDTTAASLLRGRLVAAQAACLNRQDRYEEAAPLAQAVLAQARALQDARLEAVSRFQWASALHRLGEGVAAQAQFEESAALARLVQAPWLEADSLRLMGSLVSVEGDYTAAIGCYTQALALDRRHGDRRGEARTLTYLGGAEWNLGNFSQARTYQEQALSISHAVGDAYDEVLIRHNLADTYWPEGIFTQSQTGYEQCLKVWREMGRRSGMAMELTDLGMVLILQGDYASAAAYLSEAVPLLEAIKARVGISHAYLCQGMLCHRLGDLGAAREWLQQSLDLAYGQADRRMQADAQGVLGDVLADLGNWAAARAAYEDAVTKRLSMRQPHLGLEPLAGLARVALGQGRLTESLDWLGRIWPGSVGPLPDGLWNPVQVYLTGYSTWRAARDPRAERALRTGADVLQRRAAQFTSDVRRRAFLDNVPAHRALLALTREMVRM